MNPSSKPKYISKAERAKLEFKQDESTPDVDASKARPALGNENES